jgi:ADP-ribosyl-[dinitrogen reductase] hydrolase
MVANILISHGAMQRAALGFLLQSRESKTGCDELRLGEEILRRNILWFHLPIVDVSIPDERFGEEWDIAGEALRSILRRGSDDVQVHCRGRLGRAGTIAARLLIEFGMEPEIAIARVRAVRPGTIETRAKEEYVLNTVPARK